MPFQFFHRDEPVTGSMWWADDDPTRFILGMATVAGGFVADRTLSREQLEQLRDACNVALVRTDPS